MNIFRIVRFYYLNDRWERSTLRRWKREGRIPKNYCGSLTAIAPWVELEEIQRQEQSQSKPNFRAL